MASSIWRTHRTYRCASHARRAEQVWRLSEELLLRQEAAMPGSYIVAGARTPIGKMSGALADFSAADLGGFAIAEALRRADVQLTPPGASRAKTKIAWRCKATLVLLLRLPLVVLPMRLCRSRCPNERGTRSS
ncbi:MAG: hypothetical protein EB145_14170 [Proteobacteria bacterium]|nr:hypothetical protein [Pseudomonadota bacterium]